MHAAASRCLDVRAFNISDHNSASLQLQPRTAQTLIRAVPASTTSINLIAYGAADPMRPPLALRVRHGRGDSVASQPAKALRAGAAVLLVRAVVVVAAVCSVFVGSRLASRILDPAVQRRSSPLPRGAGLRSIVVTNEESWTEMVRKLRRSHLSSHHHGGGESDSDEYKAPPRDDGVPDYDGDYAANDTEASLAAASWRADYVDDGPADNDAPTTVDKPLLAAVPASTAALPQDRVPAVALSPAQPPATTALTDDDMPSAPTTTANADGAASSGGFGSAHDLGGHRADTHCWQHFDFGYLDAWDELAATFCEPVVPSSGAADGDAHRSAVTAHNLTYSPPAVDPTAAGGGWLVCRVQTDEHLPPATAPHTMCDAGGLVVDYALLTPTACLASRPGYKCDGPPVHWSYGAGALTTAPACVRAPAFVEYAFPRDHLRDLFNAWSVQPAGVEAAPLVNTAAPVTLFIARERGEHANLFHATSDMLNAFFHLHVAGIVDGHSGSRSRMGEVGVVLLDEQEGPFDGDLWGRVFSPVHGVRRAGQLVAARARLRYPRALFVPPGYSNLFLAGVGSDLDCHPRGGSHVYQAFRRFVLEGAGLLQPGVDAPPPVGAPLRVTFVSRRPYDAFVNHFAVGRQIDNEEAVIEALRSGATAGAASIAAVEVTRVDFARMPVAEQLAVVAATDVLVGMHGAALTYSLYLAPHAGVLELWPKPVEMWRCFEHMASLAGLAYERWANDAFPEGFRSDEHGDYTVVNADAVTAMAKRITAEVVRRLDARRRGAVMLEGDTGGHHHT